MMSWMTFYVYDNTVNDRARIHRADCPHCNDGQGRDGHAERRHGRFFGPFTSYRDAAEKMATLGRRNTGDCGHCTPAVNGAP